jgi:hypothetical protein
MGVIVHANGAEVLAEPRFHRPAKSVVERVTGRAQHIVHDLGRDHSVGARASWRSRLHLWSSIRSVSVHHLVGDGVGVLLECIVWGANDKAAMRAGVLGLPFMLAPRTSSAAGAPAGFASDDFAGARLGTRRRSAVPRGAPICFYRVHVRLRHHESLRFPKLNSCDVRVKRQFFAPPPIALNAGVSPVARSSV